MSALTTKFSTGSTAVMARQDSSCMHLAHHELESVVVIIIINVISIIIYREEAQAVQEEQQYHKLHQKQVQAQQDSAWMHSVPEWHDAELVGQNKPWTVPSQLLTAEEEVGPISVLGIGAVFVLGTSAGDVSH